MLKITTQKKDGVTNITLEGKLAGPWVKELALIWQMAGTKPQDIVCVNLSAVTFIDPEGKNLLISMHRSGIELVATGCLNRCIVEEIASSKGDNGEVLKAGTEDFS